MATSSVFLLIEIHACSYATQSFPHTHSSLTQPSYPHTASGIHTYTDTHTHTHTHPHIFGHGQNQGKQREEGASGLQLKRDPVTGTEQFSHQDTGKEDQQFQIRDIYWTENGVGTILPIILKEGRWRGTEVRHQSWHQGISDTVPG